MKAIVADRLVDANGIIENPVVLVDGAKIVEVGPRGSVAVPADAEVVDASGMVLIPGLADCHVHITGSEKGLGQTTEPIEVRAVRAVTGQCRQMTDAGFTTLQDAGGLVGLAARNIIKEGLLDGPRIRAAGRYLSQTAGHGDVAGWPSDWVREGRPFGWGWDSYLADGVPECLRGVRENLRLQVDFVKVCTGGGGGGVVDPWWVTQYTLEELRAISDAAHSYGRKVMSHVYSPEAIKRTVLGGVDTVTHANMADEATVKVMLEHGTMAVPTMTVYERMARNRPGATPSLLYERMFPNFRMMHDAGVTLALGTDSMGGTSPFGGSALELELYVEKVGLTPLQALRIGTLNPAKVMGIDKELGTLEKGKLADVVAVAGDPLQDIRILQDASKIRLVLRDGKTLKSLL